MKRAAEGPEVFRRRLVGLYALTLMEREGPVHGYGLSERIAHRTEGTWRPGPGSVYPSLRKLVSLGLARSELRARRREYTITARGRELLRRMRRWEGTTARPRPDLSPLWAEVFGSEDVGRFLLTRLRRTLDAAEAHYRRTPPAAESAKWFRSAVLAELEQAKASFSRQDAGNGTPGALREVVHAR